MFGSKEEKWRDEEKVRKEKKNERKESYVFGIKDGKSRKRKRLEIKM